ncbi:MAG TPA: peptide ABC transporter substrate-binding protein [Candidatus Limnocylindrales bacterium]|nr:peptide ABC transporter substrate-binding protein [Candidatus Limnocylindrales bacterium]
MRKPLVALLATTAIVFAACGGATTPSPSATEPVATETPTEGPSPTPTVRLDDSTYGTRVEEGTDGGQIIIGDWQEANIFNPFYLGQVTEANVASATWASLIVLTDDLRYGPDLATAVPTVDNGGVTLGEGGDAMTVTWTLRDGLKWSDGEPLTCDDFLYAHEWVMDPDNVGVITTGYDVSETECASDTEMIHHFSEVFEGYISMNVAPLPRHYLEDIPMADQSAGAGMRADEVADLPVSGAFKFESVTPGAELRLVRNDNYTSGFTGKPAHLDTLIWKWYGDASALIAGYRAGEIDFATDLAESDVPAIEDLGDQVSSVAALLYEFLRPNWADGSTVGEDGVGDCSRNPAVQDRGDGCPVSDPEFRRAITFAIDKNEINERVLGGNAQVANGSITPSAWFYSEQPAAEFDPEQAKQILEDAGWVDSDGDGVREKDGLRAKIELCTTSVQRRIDSLALIGDWLADVGIEAVPNPVTAADIFAAYNEATIDTPCALSRSNFDLAEHAFSSSIDPLGGYYSYHSSQFEPDGANDAQIVDAGIDEAYDLVRSSVDFAAIKDAMATVQQVMYEKTVEIPLYYRKSIELHSPILGNFWANGTQAGPTWNAVDWYVKG